MKRDFPDLLASNKMEVFATRQRTIDVRLLSTRGRFHHVVAYQSEDFCDLDTKRCNPLQHRDRKRRIGTFAIQRGLTFLGREEH